MRSSVRPADSQCTAASTSDSSIASATAASPEATRGIAIVEIGGMPAAVNGTILRKMSPTTSGRVRGTSARNRECD